jgi:hypothetical protein
MAKNVAAGGSFKVNKEMFDRISIEVTGGMKPKNSTRLKVDRSPHFVR